MSTDTTKGSESPEEVEGAQGAVEDSKPRPTSAKPQKKPVRRRVRVIEVLDEGDEDDIQDILDNLDAIDRAAEAPEPEAVPASRPKAVRTAEPESVRTDEPEAVRESEPEPEAVRQPEADRTAKPAPEEPASGKAAREAGSSAEPASDLEAEPEPAAATETSAGQPAKETPPTRPGFPRRREFSEGAQLAALVAVVVFVAASLTAIIFLWSRYDQLDSAKAARKAVASRATAYGNQMATYSTADIKGSQDKIKAFLTGDALKGFQGAGNAPANASGKQISTTSKVDQVLVTDVNGKLATAVVIWHLDMSSSGGQSTTVGSNLAILLDMAKVNGRWMVAHQQPLTSDLSGSGSSSGTPAPNPTPTK